MNVLEQIDLKAEAGLCAGTFGGAREFFKDIRQIIKAQPAEEICDNCNGSGEVMAMSYGHGPDDYEYPAACGKCDGTGMLPAVTPKQIERLKDVIEGECNGFSVDDKAAKAILQYVLRK